MAECVFCEIVAGNVPATVLARSAESVLIVPLNPVVDGHVIALPTTHVDDAYTHPGVTSHTMRDVSAWAATQSTHDPRYESVNLITSVGKPATQSVFHLHIHVVPRAVDDGLALPWYSGKRSKGKH